MLRSGLRQLGLVAAACLVSLLAFDVLAYLFAPASLTAFSATYKKEPAPPHMQGNMRGYFRADPVLSFDIAPNQDRGHRQPIAGAGTVAATSNDFGCRSRHGLREVREAGDYTYFAGDSFTWGFVSSDKTFASVYERQSGRLALNCGVSATGQWHQLEKLRKTARAIGRLPSRVIVGFWPNDPDDDLWHPDRTVVLDATVSGTERVTLPPPLGLVLAGKEGVPSWKRRKLSHESLVQKVQEARSAMRGGGPSDRLRAFLQRHSLTHQLLGHAEGRAKDIYHLIRIRNSAAQRPHYEEDPYSRPHRQALKAWKNHAEKHGYELWVVLIPELRFWRQEARQQLRAEWMAHLDALGLRYLDFHAAAEALHIPPRTMYWRHDAHLNEEGNRILGEWLARELP